MSVLGLVICLQISDNFKWVKPRANLFQNAWRDQHQMIHAENRKYKMEKLWLYLNNFENNTRPHEYLVSWSTYGQIPATSLIPSAQRKSFNVRSPLLTTWLISIPTIHAFSVSRWSMLRGQSLTLSDPSLILPRLSYHTSYSKHHLPWHYCTTIQQYNNRNGLLDLQLHVVCVACLCRGRTALYSYCRSYTPETRLLVLFLSQILSLPCPWFSFGPWLSTSQLPAVRENRLLDKVSIMPVVIKHIVTEWVVSCSQPCS